jgi:geranylgeranyl diphosphate synthase type II
LYNFKEKYEQYLKIFEDYANSQANQLTTMPDILGESMKYSLFLGGKRIRPVLALAVAEIFNLPNDVILPYALALEMIHTYSLIHDDLPAMDNDDFRRGKPSNHKKYGEANAILAGDGLLNTAYGICISQCAKGEKFCIASQILCECAGINGMIAGQSLDLKFTSSNEPCTEKDLLAIYKLKTGKLLLAPILIASVLSGGKNYFELEEFGQNLGYLFQFTDDILDEIGSFEKLGKTIGKDKTEKKLTSISFYGLEGAKIQADFRAAKCYNVLDGIDGDTEFLSDLISYIRNREN